VLLRKEQLHQVVAAQRSKRGGQTHSADCTLAGQLLQAANQLLQHYEVTYYGIIKGYEDLGRDLICRNQYEDVIIQCKNWSQFKTIYEKHIFQFFGTVFQYRHLHPDRKVRAIFYTTTQVSDLARRFASELGIELQEKIKFDQTYPCVKCNINLTTKERIYHLPFDQQYDTTKIVNPGEFYCRTVKEAEEAGFRRALRWQGNKEHPVLGKTGSVQGNLF
jgi:restriction endonuclease